MKKKKLGFKKKIEFYSDMIALLINKGDDEVKPNVPEGKLTIGASRIYTKKTIKKVYYVRDLPETVEEEFFDALRASIDDYNALTADYKKASIRICALVSPYSFDLKSKKTRNRLMYWKNRHDEIKQSMAGEDNTDELLKTEKEIFTRKKEIHMMKSFEFVQAVQKNKQALGKLSIFIELEAEDADALRDAELSLTGYCAYNNITLKPVIINLFDYLQGYSPMSMQNWALTRKMFGRFIFSDETISKLFTYSQGCMGDKTGIYMGTGSKTMEPIAKNTMKGTGAQNLLVVAETGGGKSFYVKVLIIMFLINGYAVNVLDYEGDEYTPIGTYLGGNIISLRGADTKYFDTVEIGTLTGDDEIDKPLKDNAIQVTKRIFDIICDEENGMTASEAAIFSDAINEVYREAGVTNDKHTWVKSKGKSNHDVYQKIKSYENLELYQNRYGNDLSKFVDKLKVFFDEDGMYSFVFKNKITFDEVVKNNFNIFSFGMAGGNQVASDPKLFKLKQLFTSHITTLINNYNKHIKHIHTFNVIEEAQRYLALEGAASIVSDLVTGARKRDAVTAICSNSPLSIIESKDVHSIAIADNITTVVIGKLKMDTAKKVAEYYNAPHCIKMLNDIATLPQYEHYFLLKIGTNYSMVKMDIPEGVAKSAIFKTRNGE